MLIYITESFTKVDVLSKDLPQYIATSLSNNKENTSIKLQAEDI